MPEEARQNLGHKHFPLFLDGAHRPQAPDLEHPTLFPGVDEELPTSPTTELRKGKGSWT